MKRLLTYGLLSFIALILLAVYLISCNTGREHLGGNLKDASSTGSIVLADLDDDSNPYKGQYKAWDRWVFEHAGAEDPYKIDKPPEEMTPEERTAYVFRNNYPSNWTECKATVLDEKYLIPFEISIYEGREAYANHTADEYYSTVNVITARGVMNPNLNDEMLVRGEEITAEFYMPIPEWLAKNPPKAAMLLPNGDIVTDGLLGSAGNEEDHHESGSCCGGTSLYCLYSENGELLRTNNNFWWFLYHNEAECPTGSMVASPDGYVRFYNDAGELDSIWDFDGIKLESEEAATPRSPYHFEMLGSNSIVRFFAASHN